MARVPISGPVSIADLNTACGYGYSLSSYRRTSTSVKNNVPALVPGDGTVSLNRLRGAYPSGTYRDLNILASSTTTGINVFPRNFNTAYTAGLSNNSDPANAYTLYNSKVTGNQGYSTQGNMYTQTYNSDASQTNGMYFRVSTVSPTWAGNFEAAGSWVVAIGFNYFTANLSTTFDTYVWEFPGDGNSYYASLGASFAQVFDGNNFFAAFNDGGTIYFGLLNRAQLRAGVIQPVLSIAMFSPDAWWYNSINTICPRLTFWPASLSSLQLKLAWDEYIVRGYDIPDGARLYGQGDTATRNTVINSSPYQTCEGRIFE